MSQNKEQNENNQEIVFPKDIEIKFIRLNPPNFNSFNLPLSGLYNDLDNIEEDSENPINNKFSNFELTSSSVNIENLFSFNSFFGRVYYNEKIEGLIMFINTSDHEVVLNSLKVDLTIEEKPETRTKKKTKIMDIKLPKEGVILDKKEVYSLKFVSPLDYSSKFTIFIDVKARSPEYDEQYNLASQKYFIKDKGKDYKIIGNNVEVSNCKKLTFDVNYPFKSIEKFHNHQMNTCYIEIKITNNTIYTLTLTDLYLSPKSNPNYKIPLIDNLQDLAKTQAQYLFESDNNSELIQNLTPSEYLTLQSEEETNVLFKISDSKLFFEEEKFVLTINWLNMFDALEKIYTYEFSNTLNTFNDYYKITVAQKPEKDIIKNENFKIILNLKTKNPKKKFLITLSQESLRDNDKSNDREIEIIDIVEKKIELNNNKLENNFILICKSDVLGYVYLPRLKFLLYEGNNTNPNGNVYDALLSFNCIQKKEQ